MESSRCDTPRLPGRIDVTGRTLFFNSFAPDLVPREYNGKSDVFLVTLGGPDTDGDELDDDWEMAYFDTLERDGTGDFDGDHHSDREEFQSGTDPTDEDSILRLISLRVPGTGLVSLTWSAVPGRSYQVQSRVIVDGAEWIDMANPVTAAGTIAMLSAVEEITVDQRYYRVLLVED